MTSIGRGRHMPHSRNLGRGVKFDGRDGTGAQAFQE